MNHAAIQDAFDSQFADADPEVCEWCEAYATETVEQFAATQPVGTRPTKERIGTWKARGKREFKASTLGRAKQKEFGLFGIFEWFAMISQVAKMLMLIWEMYRTENAGDQPTGEVT